MVGHRLIEAVAAKALRGKEIGGEFLEKIGVILAVLAEKRVFLDGFNKLFGLSVEVGGVRGLKLEQAEPCLEIDEGALLSRGDAPGLEGYIEKGLALGGNKIIQGQFSAGDLTHLGGSGIPPVGCPVAEKDEGDAYDSEKDEEKAF